MVTHPTMRLADFDFGYFSNSLPAVTRNMIGGSKNDKMVVQLINIGGRFQQLQVTCF